MNEFEIIRKYFGARPVKRADVVLGIGDDAALVTVPFDQELVVATDMLVSGVHFPEATDPGSIGHKALAVNLSDMAAMGAAPAWFTLNLSLPTADGAWLEAFSRGMFELADSFDVALIGGDTARGPLAVGVQILGLVPRGKALTRSGTAPGDRIFVTGSLGDAALGLALRQGRLDLPEPFRGPLVARLDRPVPRVDAGLALRGIASACIDVSDGLLADLGHILESSGVGGRIYLDRLPRAPAFDCVAARTAWAAVLSGGDDYELCFTVPAGRESQLATVTAGFGVPCHEIGVIESDPGLRIMDAQGQVVTPAATGFEHFR